MPPPTLSPSSLHPTSTIINYSLPPLSSLSANALIPLLTSAGALTYTLSEACTLAPFLSSPAHVMDNEVISWFWYYWFRYGIANVVLWNGGSAISGFLLWRRLGALRGQQGIGQGIENARMLAGWGTIAAAGHFVFGGTVATIIERMINHPVHSREDLRKWLRVHAIRTLMTDLPAFLCFLGIVWYGV